MKISRVKLAELLVRASKSADYEKTVKQVASYLVASKRTTELNSILRDVRGQLAKNGQIEVLVKSAYPVSPEVKTDVLERTKKIYPKASKINIAEVIDDDLIGGILIDYPGQELDYSLLDKIDQFKYLTA